MKLLENLCDRVDYFFSYCMGIVLSLMQAILENNAHVDINTHYPALADIKDSRFNQMTNSEEKLDTCLLITSSVSFFLILRSEKL
jgi:hypothetical protein